MFVDCPHGVTITCDVALYKSHTFTELQAWTWRKPTCMSQPDFYTLLQLMLRVWTA